MKTLRNLSEKGMTIIMTSHSPAHAWQISNKTVLMGNGGIIAQGTPGEVMTAENLERTYDVRVKIHRSDLDDTAFFCEPAFEDL